MKTASTLLHLTALAACFAAHLAFAQELDGMRRALETSKGGQAKVEMPLAVQSAEDAS